MSIEANVEVKREAYFAVKRAAGFAARAILRLPVPARRGRKTCVAFGYHFIRSALFALYCTGLLLCSGCAMSEAAQVQLLVPAFPPEWQAALYWELTVRSDSTVLPAALMPDGNSVALVPGSAVALTLPRSAYVLFELRAVFPLDSGTGTPSAAVWRSLPYGCVYPVDLDAAGLLRPDATGGWCVAVVAPLLAGGWNPWTFNYRRFYAAASERLSDPWALAPEKLAPQLAEGRFRLDYIKTPVHWFLVPWLENGMAKKLSPATTAAQPVSAQPVSLTSAAWPDSGPPVSERPGAPFVDVSAQGQSGSAFVSACPGQYQWLWQNKRIRLQLDEQGQCWWTIQPLGTENP